MFRDHFHTTPEYVAFPMFKYWKNTCCIRMPIKQLHFIIDDSQISQSSSPYFITKIKLCELNNYFVREITYFTHFNMSPNLANKITSVSLSLLTIYLTHTVNLWHCYKFTVETRMSRINESG